MHWIALQPPPEAAPPESAQQAAPLWADPLGALGWWALQFTPRVALVDGALALELSGSERLFGGRERLLQAVFQAPGPAQHSRYARGATSLIAVGRLFQSMLEAQGAGADGAAGSVRARRCAAATPPDDLPLAALAAAQAHLPTLERMGCTRWGHLRALPRGGVARRFGAALLDALDRAYGLKNDLHPWLTLPEVFDVSLELAAHVDTAPALMFGARRLLGQLQLWLQARQHGLVALQLRWEVDQRRSLNPAPAGAQPLPGQGANPVPASDQLLLRTAQATLDMAHVQRLLAERLERTTLRAPAVTLGLRCLESAALGGATASLLPDEVRRGASLQQTLERIEARFGPGHVLRVLPYADHRPEHMQIWAAATVGQNRFAIDPPVSGAGRSKRAHWNDGNSGVLYPTWLLAQPLKLALRNQWPLYQGPLDLLAGPQRLEAAWWSASGSGQSQDKAAAGPATATLRDYFIARSEFSGLLWIYRERAAGADAAWYLHGLFS